MNSGTAAGLVTGVQVGAALVASQIVVTDTGPGLLGLLRYAIALAFVLPLVFRGRPRRIAAGDLPAMLLLGTGQIGVMIGLLNIAVLHTSSARVAIIFATLPLFTLAIDMVVRGRPSETFAKAGAGLCVAGIAVLLGADAFSGRIGGEDLVGIAAAIAGTLMIAVCSSFYRPYVERYGSPLTSAVAFAVSLVPLAALAWLLPPATMLSAWTATTWWLVIAVGLSSGIGYLTWFHAIARLTPAHVTGFLSLSPITAALLSTAFLDTALPAAMWVAIALVSAGLICFSRGDPTGKEA